MELVQQLMKSLDLNEQQAKGGIGALLYIVKDHVAHSSFHEIKTLLPEAEAWMRLSPEGGEGFIGLLDGIFGSVAGGKLDAFARMGGHFQSLGISPTMVKPFTGIVLAYMCERLPAGGRNQVTKLNDALMA